MSNSPRIPGLIPTIASLSDQALVDSLKSSALQSQGIDPSRSITSIGSAPESAIVDPTAPPQEKKDPLILLPFEDGTVVKYVERGPGTNQQIVYTAKGDQLAIVRDKDCAELVVDGVNVYFAALTHKQELENEQRAAVIADTTAKPATEDQKREARREAELSAKLLQWLAEQNVTSENIGEIRARLLMPFDCEWNSLVRDLTATFELASKNPKS